MKWLLRLAYGVIALLLIATVVGAFFKKKWSRDVERVEVSEGDYKFRAERDPTGVWLVKVDDENSLFFAMGYLQGVDREFQTEALRTVAAGRGAELMGKTGLPFSRMMRMASKVAEYEWEHRDPARPLYRALEIFAAGRNKFVKDAPIPPPIEFKLMGLERSKMAQWQAVDLLKIVRYHTWEFSYDYSEDLRHIQLGDLVGKEMLDLLLLPEPAGNEALYRQKNLKGVEANFLASGRGSAPAPFYDVLRGEKLSQRKSLPEALKYLEWDAAYGGGLPKGASNMWIVADPQRFPTPTLCNDAHLGLMWPSALYPIRYEINGRLQAAGYMLPGLPVLAIGTVDRQSPAPERFVWGITLATYANGQDLVQLSPATLAQSKRFKEKYLIREPLGSEVSEVEIEEEWTPWGPRVDEMVPWIPGHERKGVALDWMGFRNVEAPLEFFFQRTIHGADHLKEDLATHWAYPSVNFAWMRQSTPAETQFGHAVTGTLFKSSGKTRRGLLGEAEARARQFSFPSERPYVNYSYRDTEAFLFVTGNQKIYDDVLSDSISHDWVDPSRASRIVNVLTTDPEQAEAEQTDSYIPALANFVKTQRKKFSVDRLCGRAIARDECFEVVSALDAWDGRGTEESTVTTFAALWYMHSRWGLLPEGVTKDFGQKAERVQGVVKRWATLSNTARVIERMEKDTLFRDRWQNTTGRNWEGEVLAAFDKTLEQTLGATDYLKWGVVHRVSWNHPIGRMSGEAGKLLKESLLGPGPFINGGFDSPGRSDISWDPDNPLLFPTTHAAVLRMCRSFLGPRGGTDRGFRWTNVTGPSGNPYSAWGKKFSDDYYFKNRLYRVDSF